MTNALICHFLTYIHHCILYTVCVCVFACSACYCRTSTIVTCVTLCWSLRVRRTSGKLSPCTGRDSTLMVSQTSVWMLPPVRSFLHSSDCLYKIIMTGESILLRLNLFLSLKIILLPQPNTLLSGSTEKQGNISYVLNIWYIFIHFHTFHGLLHSFFINCAKMRSDDNLSDLNQR